MTTLQVIEPMWGGHHTNYLLALVPAIRALKQSGVLDSAVFTVTGVHLQYVERNGQIGATRDAVTWDPTLLDVGAKPTLRQRFSLFKSIRAAVQRTDPAALLCTSGDYDIVPNALAHRLLRKSISSARSAAILHYGYPSGSLTPREEIKRRIYQLAWRYCSWDLLLIVNPMVWEDARFRASAVSGRSMLLPDPVPEAVPVGATMAREHLGIPVDGTYVGFVGMLDKRKAVPELLAAYAAWDKRDSVRLLLAGQLDPDYRALIGRTYAELLEAGRIIIVDKFLSEEEICNGFAAIDVCTVLQYRRANLSANVLKALSYAKPVVVDAYGYPGMMATRFDAGVTCDISDVRTIAIALDRALSFNKYPASQKRKRLLEFHSYSNFAAVALGAVLDLGGVPRLMSAVKWDSICDANLGMITDLPTPSGSRSRRDA